MFRETFFNFGYLAEIRFDDTPIPTGADTSTTDKLAQRNIAWLGVQP